MSTVGIGNENVGEVLQLEWTGFVERSGTGIRRCAVALLIAVSAMAIGCGSNYRPVVSAIGVVGPASQPTKYAMVISSPTLIASGQSCPLVGATGSYAPANGLLSMVDFSGDTVLLTTELGANPFYLALNPGGTLGYTLNCDGTLNSFNISTSMIKSDVLESTLLQGSAPLNLYANGTTTYVVDPGVNAVDQMYGTPPALKQKIPIASGYEPVYLIAQSSASRDYILSQKNDGGLGTASALETSLNMTDAPLTVGTGPVYGVMTADNRRVFVLNQGDNSVSVINTVGNTLDSFKDSYHNYPITNFSISGNMVTFQSTNSLTPGQSVTISGLSTGTYLDGQTLTVATNGWTPNQFEAAFTHADVTSTKDTGTATLAGLLTSTIPVGEGPVWADLAAGLNELVVVNEGPVFTVTGYSISSQVFTLKTSPQNLHVGDTVTLSGFPASTFLNNQVVTVSSTGLASNSFQATLAHSDVTSTTEGGAGFTGDGTTTGSVSLINVPLCSSTAVTTNPNCDTNNPEDGSAFGQVLATIPVGVNPIMVSVLSDYSRAYVINAGVAGLPCVAANAAGNFVPVAGVSTTCTVSVVNLTTDTVTATVATNGHPAWIATSNASPSGKVYVVSKDSQVMTVLDTDTDSLHTTIPLQGYGISVRMTAQ